MARKKAAVGASAPTFEDALARLEAIVRELEEADLPLERSLTVFEEGVRLSRLLHERLNEAERKVEVLMKNEDGDKVPVPFAAEGVPAGGRAAACAVAADDADDVDGDDEDEEADGDDDATGGHGQSTLF
jgi:exodeoxyribonuclease VII small subunit